MLICIHVRLDCCSAITCQLTIFQLKTVFHASEKCSNERKIPEQLQRQQLCKVLRTSMHTFSNKRTYFHVIDFIQSTSDFIILCIQIYLNYSLIHGKCDECNKCNTVTLQPKRNHQTLSAENQATLVVQAPDNKHCFGISSRCINYDEHNQITILNQTTCK